MGHKRVDFEFLNMIITIAYNRPKFINVYRHPVTKVIIGVMKGILLVHSPFLAIVAWALLSCFTLNLCFLTMPLG